MKPLMFIALIFASNLQFTNGVNHKNFRIFDDFKKLIKSISVIYLFIINTVNTYI